MISLNQGLIGISLAAAVFLTGCGSDNDSVDTTSSNISGTVTKGEATEGTVKAYKADGTLIGTANITAGGAYTIPSSGYEGIVTVEASLSKYMDEATNQEVTVDGLVLESKSYVAPADLTVNVTALTDISSDLLGDGTLTKDQIVEMNKYVATAIGMGDVDISKQKPTQIDANTTSVVLGNDTRYGAALSAVSKDSAIATANAGAANKINVTASIEKLKNAILKSQTDNAADVESFIESKLTASGITFSGAGTNGVDIITSTNNTVVVNAAIKAKVAIAKIRAYAKNSINPAPTLQDYIDAGITGVTSSNLNDVNNIVSVDFKGDEPESSAKMTLQTKITALPARLAAIAKLRDFATTSDHPDPTLQDYIDAGITGVTSNLNDVNFIVDTQYDGTEDEAVAKASLQTKITALVASKLAVEKIKNYATSNTNPAPTVQDYIDAGITAMTSEKLADANNLINNQEGVDVDTSDKISSVLSSLFSNPATAKVKAYGLDPDNKPVPTAEDYTAAGLTGTLVSLRSMNFIVQKYGTWFKDQSDESIAEVLNNTNERILRKPTTKEELQALITDSGYITSESDGHHRLVYADTSLITDMSLLFEYQSSFNIDISRWDTSNVTSMMGMFSGATSFNQPIGDWNTSKVEDMSGMFFGATSFNQPIGSWDTSKVENMSHMFRQAEAFNQPIGSWDTSKVQDMQEMFAYTTIFNQPIGSWNVSSVRNMLGMFGEAIAFNQDISTWTFNSELTTIDSMFERAIAFNQDLGGWDIPSTTSHEKYDFEATAWEAGKKINFSN